MDAFAALFKSCTTSTKVRRLATSAGELRLGGDMAVVAKALRAGLSRTKNGLVEIPFEQVSKVKQKATGSVVEADTASGIVADDTGGKVRWFSVYFAQSI